MSGGPPSFSRAFGGLSASCLGSWRHRLPEGNGLNRRRAVLIMQLPLDPLKP